MKQLMKLAGAAALGAIASGTIVYAQASAPEPHAIVSLYHAAPGHQEALLTWFAEQDRVRSRRRSRADAALHPHRR